MLWEMDFLHFAANNFKSELLDFFMVFVTTLGNGGFIWIFITLLLIIFKSTRPAGIASAVALVIMLVSVNMIIKPAVGRIRPYIVSPELLNYVIISLPSDASFPSGHTAAGFASATAVFCKSKRIGAFMYPLAFLIGISRLYLCVHYPTDVICGMLIGILTGIIAFKITKKYVDKSI